jgi:hypothetical protein
MRVALYARVSTKDQNTLPLQMKAMRSLARQRNWTVAMAVKEVASGASERPARQSILDAVRRHRIDAVIVWKMDRWGRSLSDLVATLKELSELGVSFVSVTEFFDLGTTTGVNGLWCYRLGAHSPGASATGSDDEIAVAQEPARKRLQRFVPKVSVVLQAVAEPSEYRDAVAARMRRKNVRRLC